MKQRKSLGKGALIAASLTLMSISLWEICVRLDAMYAPIKMFFSMALGENIPLSSAMNYFNWSIFETPLWLAGCLLISLLSLALCSRPKGGFFLLPVCLFMALYGLTRKGTLFVGFWQLIQPALLLILSALSMLNLILIPIRCRTRSKKTSPPPASPRMTDAPRLKRIHQNPDRHAG